MVSLAILSVVVDGHFEPATGHVESVGLELGAKGGIEAVEEIRVVGASLVPKLPLSSLYISHKLLLSKKLLSRFGQVPRKRPIS